MKKIYLSVLGFALICRMQVYAQTAKDSIGRLNPGFSLATTAAQDTNAYRPRRLRVDEVNFVSSYYKQDGNHSAVTGGIGTEKVTDIANGIDLKLVWFGNTLNKNTLSVGLGFDHHTSASAAYVSQTGASNTGGSRVYPSLDWTVENTKKGTSFGIGSYYSGEYNYQSLGADLHFSAKTTNRMGEFGVKVQGYFDQVKLIYPSEFIPQSTTTVTTVTTASGNSSTSQGGGKAKIPSSPRNTYSASFSYSQIVTSRLQIMFLADVVTQHGFLSLPFHRVYFSNGKDTIERLPSSRFKLPLGFRANYFLGDNVILRSYYRYYTDNWGTKSNTANLEIAYKVTPFFSISPFYRYYTQTAAKYFAPYEQNSASQTYFTSNYEYAKFNSQFFGAGIRLAPPKGVLGWQSLHEVEIRYGHYKQDTGLSSDVVSLSLGFK
ncbi:Protein of unknown function [Mucilaginibacter pineti]|uniref:DUF3570 domain-containing protein n=1 Tax=Mucilaginibacter pineti TaxID=1391627 RepID=A0A1G6XHI8_9SPHI|nr:DUF3570 domain-containing protein [Mucilaginibacter pineti]SDD77521.1 Protein of unknown function [Mucilaginibacter pineti]